MSDAGHWAQLCLLTFRLSRMLRVLARTERRTPRLQPRFDSMLRRMRDVSQALHDSSEQAVRCEPRTSASATGKGACNGGSRPKECHHQHR